MSTENLIKIKIHLHLKQLTNINSFIQVMYKYLIIGININNSFQ
jgi:hypothetical protein